MPLTVSTPASRIPTASSGHSTGDGVPQRAAVTHLGQGQKKSVTQEDIGSQGQKNAEQEQFPPL